MLLQTKLYISSLRPNIVSRPQLIKKLNLGLDGKLTLISAAAGFGKTALLRDRIGQSDTAVTWTSSH